MLDQERLSYLKADCYLDVLSSILSRPAPTELEACILRAVFWFAEAYRDRTPVMQFIKLWSCAENFFAVKHDGISELNAKGLATILTFAGYQLSSPAKS